MIRSIVCIVALVVSATPVSAQSAHDTGHDRHQHEATSGVPALQLNDGERWAPDESLRTGMTAVRTAFEQAHAKYERGNFGATDAGALADRIEQQVDFMIANCKLPPAADTELHKLLAASLTAASTLRKADDPHTGLHELHGVLNTYARYFHHPGWDD